MKRRSSKILKPLLPKDEGEDQWMLSYSDMMTLLLTFFVLLFALSKIDPVKLQIVAQSMNRAIGGAPTKPQVTLAQIESDLRRIVHEEGLETQVEVRRDMHGVALSLKGSTFFRSGSTELLNSAVPFLEIIARQIKSVPYQIAIEGHTDDVPIHTDMFPSNWELSTARAGKVVRFFMENGVAADRMRAMGFADTKPVDMKIGNQTEEARARNRRVVVLFLDEIR